MKSVLAIAALLLVTACGKKEMPREHGDLPWGCSRVQVLRIDTSNDGTQQSLMEKQGEHKIRFLRDGNFGNVGDVFTFCG